LLNVGPKADGTFPQESIDILKGIGEWMKVNGEAIYGTTASPFAPVIWGRVTKKEAKGNTILYFHVFDWPKDGNLTLPAFSNQVVSVSLLGSGERIKEKTLNGITELKLPGQAPGTIASVIKVEVKGSVASDKIPGKDKMKAGELD
jgi:alpha-L-fucosidase